MTVVIERTSPTLSADSIADHHLVVDLVPALARLYFLDRLPVSLSFTQVAAPLSEQTFRTMTRVLSMCRASWGSAPSWRVLSAWRGSVPCLATVTGLHRSPTVVAERCCPARWRALSEQDRNVLLSPEGVYSRDMDRGNSREGGGSDTNPVRSDTNCLRSDTNPPCAPLLHKGGGAARDGAPAQDHRRARGVLLHREETAHD